MCSQSEIVSLFYMEDVQLYSFNMKKHEIQKRKSFRKEDFRSRKTNNKQGAVFHLFFSPCVLSIEKIKVQDKHQGSNVLKRNCATLSKYQILL